MLVCHHQGGATLVLCPCWNMTGKGSNTHFPEGIMARAYHAIGGRVLRQRRDLRVL